MVNSQGVSVVDNSVKKAQLVLGRSDSGKGIGVDLESFFAFNFQITEELENLVDDWTYFVGCADPSFRPSSPPLPPQLPR